MQIFFGAEAVAFGWNRLRFLLPPSFEFFNNAFHLIGIFSYDERVARSVFSEIFLKLDQFFGWLVPIATTRESIHLVGNYILKNLVDKFIDLDYLDIQ
jgi:hypothetical protein